MNIPGFYVSTAKEKLNIHWVCVQLQNSYWGKWLADDQIQRAIANSLCFGVYEEDQVIDGGEIAVTGRQVGFGRVVTDKATFSSAMDIIIDEALRNRGLGSMLIETMLAHPDVRGTINIISTEDASLFYDRFGWTPCPGVLRRDPK